jgi:hypothetical protein
MSPYEVVVPSVYVFRSRLESAAPINEEYEHEAAVRHDEILHEWRNLLYSALLIYLTVTVPLPTLVSRQISMQCTNTTREGKLLRPDKSG